MAFDNEVILHNPGTNLTATVTGTGKDIQGTPFDGIWIRAVVLQATGTSPTLDITIQGSTDDSTYTTKSTFPQITAAGVYWQKHQDKRRYIRSVLTVGGTNPNFGKVQVGPATGPEYKS